MNYIGISIQIKKDTGDWESTQPTFHRVPEDLGYMSELCQLIANATKSNVRVCFISEEYWKMKDISNSTKDVSSFGASYFRYHKS